MLLMSMLMSVGKFDVILCRYFQNHCRATGIQWDSAIITRGRIHKKTLYDAVSNDVQHAKGMLS